MVPDCESARVAAETTAPAGSTTLKFKTGEADPDADAKSGAFVPLEVKDHVVLDVKSIVPAVAA